MQRTIRRVTGKAEEGQPGASTRTSRRSNSIAESDVSDNPQLAVAGYLSSAGRDISNANMLATDISRYTLEQDILMRGERKLRDMRRNQHAQIDAFNTFSTDLVANIKPLPPGVNYNGFKFPDEDDLVNTRLGMSAKEQLIAGLLDTDVRQINMKKQYIANSTKALEEARTRATSKLEQAANVEKTWADNLLATDDAISAEIPTATGAGSDGEEEDDAEDDADYE